MSLVEFQTFASPRPKRLHGVGPHFERAKRLILIEIAK
jgi:hypothetical protein